MRQNRRIVLGDEAVAQAVLDAGTSGAYAYPGTPSTEILEYLLNNEKASGKVTVQWSANEKTAMETALGMSYAGKRSLVAMKHVGLNVAMDIFVNMAISGVNGGLVVVVADDPSMHSSQNEQDSRYLADFAKIPILEPGNQQEAYDMVHQAFKMSEFLKLPVMLRLVTRLAHSRSLVTFHSSHAMNPIHFPEDTNRFRLVPIYARNAYERLLSLQDKISECSEDSAFNKLLLSPGSRLGIIVSGIAYNYLMENGDLPDSYHILKISQYNLPRKLIKQLYEHSDVIYIFEEGYPFIEEKITTFLHEQKEIKGKLSGHVPRTGELNPDIIATALGVQKGQVYSSPEWLRGRPPQLCEGCGHADVFKALNFLKKEWGDHRYFGDIGCYALGALAPHHTISTLIDMGASITMAKGASDAGVHPSVALIGDSTFIHSGMTGLLDCVYHNTPITVIILDNSAVAMTGGQDSLAESRLAQICLGLGVKKKHLKVINPLPKNHDINVDIIRNEMKYKGVSVIIARRACVRLPANKQKNIKDLLEFSN